MGIGDCCACTDIDASKLANRFGLTASFQSGETYLGMKDAANELAKIITAKDREELRELAQIMPASFHVTSKPEIKIVDLAFDCFFKLDRHERRQAMPGWVEYEDGSKAQSAERCYFRGVRSFWRSLAVAEPEKAALWVMAFQRSVSEIPEHGKAPQIID